LANQKKLDNILGQRCIATNRTISINVTQGIVGEWRNDSNPNVACMGAKPPAS
jgi:hypothetical protein